MKGFNFFILLAIPFLLMAQSRERHCLSEAEMALVQLINMERMNHGLDTIPLSYSLSVVARTHCRDLMENSPDKAPCNMHSWSGKGEWKRCCYTSDHRKAACMWNKPRELSYYTGDGFEITFFSDPFPEMPEEAAYISIKAWRDSKAHSDVMMNQEKWKEIEWKAMGVGIYGNYVTAWFGRAVDPDGSARICD